MPVAIAGRLDGRCCVYLLDPWTGSARTTRFLVGASMQSTRLASSSVGVVPQLPDASNHHAFPKTLPRGEHNRQLVLCRPRSRRPAASLLYALKTSLFNLSQGTDAEAPNSFGDCFGTQCRQSVAPTQIKIGIARPLRTPLWQFKLNSGTPISV